MIFAALFILLDAAKGTGMSNNAVGTEKTIDDAFKNLENAIANTGYNDKERQEYADLLKKLQPEAVYNDVCKDFAGLDKSHCETISGKKICSCKLANECGDKNMVTSLATYTTSQPYIPSFSTRKITSITVTSYLPTETIYVTPNSAQKMLQNSSVAFASTVKTSAACQTPSAETINHPPHIKTTFINDTCPLNGEKQDMHTQTCQAKTRNSSVTQKHRPIFKIPVVTPIVTFTQAIATTVTDHVPTVVVQTSYLTQPYYYPPQILTQTVTIASNTNPLLHDIKRMLNMAMLKNQPSTVYVTQPSNNYLETLYSQQKNEICKLSGELSRVYQLINQGAVIKPKNKVCYVSSGKLKKNNCVTQNKPQPKNECDAFKGSRKQTHVIKTVRINGGVVSPKELCELRNKVKCCNDKNKHENCKVCKTSDSDSDSAFIDCYSTCLEICDKKDKKCKDKCDKLCDRKQKCKIPPKTIEKCDDNKTKICEENSSEDSDFDNASKNCKTTNFTNSEYSTTSFISSSLSNACETNAIPPNASNCTIVSTKASSSTCEGNEKYTTKTWGVSVPSNCSLENKTITKDLSESSSSSDEKEENTSNCYKSCKTTCKTNKLQQNAKKHCLKNCIEDCNIKNDNISCDNEHSKEFDWYNYFEKCVESCRNYKKYINRNENDRKCSKKCFKSKNPLYKDSIISQTVRLGSVPKKDTISKHPEDMQSKHAQKSFGNEAVSNLVEIGTDTGLSSYHISSHVLDMAQMYNTNVTYDSPEKQTVSKIQSGVAFSDMTNNLDGSGDNPQNTSFLSTVSKKSIEKDHKNTNTRSSNYLFDILTTIIARPESNGAYTTQTMKTHLLASPHASKSLESLGLNNKYESGSLEHAGNDRLPIESVEIGDVVTASSAINDDDTDSDNLEYFYLSDLFSDSNMYGE